MILRNASIVIRITNAEVRVLELKKQSIEDSLVIMRFKICIVLIF